MKGCDLKSFFVCLEFCSWEGCVYFFSGESRPGSVRTGLFVLLLYIIWSLVWLRCRLIFYWNCYNIIWSLCNETPVLILHSMEKWKKSVYLRKSGISGLNWLETTKTRLKKCFYWRKKYGEFFFSIFHENFRQNFTKKNFRQIFFFSIFSNKIENLIKMLKVDFKF